MSTWNYRYVYNVNEDRLFVTEVYYNSKGEPVSYADKAAELEGFNYGDSHNIDILFDDLNHTLKTINKDLKRNPDILFYPKAFKGDLFE